MVFAKRPYRLRLLTLVLLALVAASMFWLLRDFAIQSGDYGQYQTRDEYGAPKLIFHIREPGAVLMWQAAAWSYRAATAPGWKASLSPEERAFGFDLTGAISGGFYVLFLLLWLGEFDASWKRKAIAGTIVLCSSITWTFVGHIEFYAPLHAALMFLYWRIMRCARGCNPASFWWLMVAALIAATMHRVAIVHFPALLVFLRRPESRFGFYKPPLWQLRSVLTVLIGGISIHVLACLLYMSGARILVMEDYNWLPELITPFTESWANHVVANSKLGSIHQFTFGSAAHWEHFFFFMAVSAPLGLLTILFFGRGGLPRVTRHQKLLMLSAASAWFWALLWHPHLGFGDWDLFSHPGLPMNLFAATLVLSSGGGAEAEGQGSATEDG